MPVVISIKTIKPFANVHPTGREIFVKRQFKPQQVLLVNSLKLHIICFINKYIFKSFKLVLMKNF